VPRPTASAVSSAGYSTDGWANVSSKATRSQTSLIASAPTQTTAISGTGSADATTARQVTRTRTRSMRSKVDLDRGRASVRATAASSAATGRRPLVQTTAAAATEIAAAPGRDIRSASGP
jgi:hypothetical protein